MMGFCTSYWSSTLVPRLEQFDPELNNIFLSELTPELNYHDDSLLLNNSFLDPNHFFYDNDDVLTAPRNQLQCFPLRDEDINFLNCIQSDQIVRASNYSCDHFLPVRHFNCVDHAQMLTLQHSQVPAAAAVAACGNDGNASIVVRRDKRKQQGGKGGCGLSAQSLAARERRRRITEKTQQLAKLIPGAHKMNTADMFHAGFKYVKFLQSQLAVLQSLNSMHHQDDEGADTAWELQSLLLESTVVQEKLYMEEKCLVTEELFDSLGSSSGNDGLDSVEF